MIVKSVRNGIIFRSAQIRCDYSYYFHDAIYTDDYHQDVSCKRIDQCGGPKSKQAHSFVAVRSCSHDTTHLWSVQVLSVCLTADVAEGQSLDEIP